MKVAVIGSRNLEIDNLEKYSPEGVTEIVSGGAKGVDTSAVEYAIAHDLKLTVFLPEYEKYGRAAPLKRNITIIENADLVIAFWDGASRGTKYVIDACKRKNVPVVVHILVTPYLSSETEYKKVLIEGKNTPLSECGSENEVEF